VLVTQFDLARCAVWTGDPPGIRRLPAAAVAFAQFDSPLSHDREPISGKVKMTADAARRTVLVPATHWWACATIRAGGGIPAMSRTRRGTITNP
jgi:hypothetical protein